MPSASGRQDRAMVLVVGAGVSGCACAAALATAGFRVTVVNSAMDRVGLPAYGPDLIGETKQWGPLREALNVLPPPLRAVWLQASTWPASGQAILNIDRRRISIESKRVLERIPGLQFRQGFVTGLRLRMPELCGEEGAEQARVSGSGPAVEQAHAAQVEVETVFGEVFQADAVVIAAGLSLGAQTAVGADLVEGGRYGEPASEGLRAAFDALGVEFAATTVEVGPRVLARHATARGWVRDRSAVDGLGHGEPTGGEAVGGEPTGAARGVVAAGGGVDGRGFSMNKDDSPWFWAQAGGGRDGSDIGSGLDDDLMSEELLVPMPVEQSAHCWPEGYPPAPHWHQELRIHRMVTMAGKVGRRDADGVPALSPDGAATSEVCLAPGGPFARDTAARTTEGGSVIASRMPSTVRGMMIVGLSDTGRVRLGGRPGPIWIVGRLAGARDYVASLVSGVRTANDIAGNLGGLRGEASVTDEDVVSGDGG